MLLLPIMQVAAMSDQQIIQKAVSLQSQGIGEQEIAKQLLLDGATPEQLQRVSNQLKQMQQASANSANATGNATSSAIRKDNGETEPPKSAPSKDASKVFGQDIFRSPDAKFQPNMNQATPKNYTLGPGDEIIIDIFGAAQLNMHKTISPDGNVIVDGYGPVNLGGMTVVDATRRLKNTVGKRYQGSQIMLSLGQTRTITVNVMGEVTMPGSYQLSAFANVMNALYMAGGINDVGTLRNIKVYRNGRMIAAIDVYDHILNGKSVNIHLADNDVIYVGTYDCLVNITGKVKRPMYYEMKKNESVATLLKYAGGFTGDAYTKSVRLIRKTGRQYSIHNIEEFDLSSFHVSDEDSVSVDSIIARFENSVEVKGAVFRPGMYEVGNDINSVRTLIEHAEGVREEAFTDHAVMHRMRADRTLEVIPVDVQGILDGRVVDIPLQANDVLFIPTKQEMMQERTLTIHGEVHYPGIYKYAANETVEDLILQAGGLKETASTVKVNIARRINNPKATSPDSIISQTFTLALKDGFVIDGEPGFVLMPYDEIYVRQSPGFNIQKNVRVEGNVMFAGVYTLSSKNERISDIIKKAGGLNDLAYIRGARLERRTNEDERLRMQTVLRMLQAQAGQKDSLNIALLELGDTYPVGIDFEKALKNPGCDEDIVLREGDRIFVPEYNGTVKISGDVMYPNTVTYEKGKRPSYYIDQAGGWGNRAKKSNTYIIYMNGKVAKVGHNAKVQPGCEIIVPSKPKNSGRSLTEWLTIGSSVSSIAAMIATIANIVK